MPREKIEELKQQKSVADQVKDEVALGMRRDGALRLTVYNDGPWSQEDPPVAPNRVGLGNLRTRLQILHGELSDLLLQPSEQGGVEVIVTLPLQET